MAGCLVGYRCIGIHQDLILFSLPSLHSYPHHGPSYRPSCRTMRSSIRVCYVCIKQFLFGFPCPREIECHRSNIRRNFHSGQISRRYNVLPILSSDKGDLIDRSDNPVCNENRLIPRVLIEAVPSGERGGWRWECADVEEFSLTKGAF